MKSDTERIVALERQVERLTAQVAHAKRMLQIITKTYDRWAMSFGRKPWQTVADQMNRTALRAIEDIDDPTMQASDYPTMINERAFKPRSAKACRYCTKQQLCSYHQQHAPNVVAKETNDE